MQLPTVTVNVQLYPVWSWKITLNGLKQSFCIRHEQLHCKISKLWPPQFIPSAPVVKWNDIIELNIVIEAPIMERNEKSRAALKSRLAKNIMANDYGKQVDYLKMNTIQMDKNAILLWHIKLGELIEQARLVHYATKQSHQRLMGSYLRDTEMLMTRTNLSG